MPQPPIPPVPVELRRALLDQVLAFQQAAPWQWMPDSAISTYIDPSGQPWFACVLGANRLVYGLCLYRGANGLRLHRRVQEDGPNFDPAAHRHTQDALSIWFGPKADLDRVQLQIYQELGYAPKRGARLAWPDMRSHRPGFFPWPLEEHEVRVLLAAIPRVLRFAECYRQQPDCYDRHGARDIPELPAEHAPAIPEKLEWRTWPTPPPEPINPPVLVDITAAPLPAILALPRANETIEVDWFYMPEAVADGARPYYARCLVALRTDGGYCYGMELLKPDDDVAAHAVNLLLNAFGKLNARPTRILTSKAELASRLEPLAAAIGAKSQTARDLPATAELRQSLIAHMSAR